MGLKKIISRNVIMQLTKETSADSSVSKIHFMTYNAGNAQSLTPQTESCIEYLTPTDFITGPMYIVLMR